MMLLAQQPHAARIAGFLAGVVLCLGITLIVGTLVGAVILRSACMLYNSFVGGSKTRRAVPLPDFSRAMGIVFLSIVAYIGASVVVGLAIGGSVGMLGKDVRIAQGIAQLVILPLGFFVLSRFDRWNATDVI